MPFILTLVIGAAVGFIITRLMGMDTNVPITIAIGVIGAIVGGVLLRLAVLAVSATSGVLGLLVGAALGSVLLVLIFRRFF